MAASGAWFVGGLGAFLVVATTGLAQEQEGENWQGAAAVRHETMESFGAHTSAMQKILTEAPELLPQVAAHATALSELSRGIPAMFPPGSEGPPSEALPAVWSDRAGFEAASTRAADLAQTLADTAKAGDRQATLAAFAAMGKQGCGGCHQTYRQKQPS